MGRNCSVIFLRLDLILDEHKYQPSHFIQRCVSRSLSFFAFSSSSSCLLFLVYQLYTRTSTLFCCEICAFLLRMNLCLSMKLVDCLWNREYRWWKGKSTSMHCEHISAIFVFVLMWSLLWNDVRVCLFFSFFSSILSIGLVSICFSLLIDQSKI